ncbi:MAG: SoxR reducing system RseC family protein [Wenzhouxiangellaceae bacterium]|nr:SoxR reducing system RseC family protein [Wenzhouxiangellaceae bacterium]
MSEAPARGLIWQTAVVRAHGDGRGWLEFADAGRCARCESGTGCGAALFSRLFTRRSPALPLPPGAEFDSGRIVRVGVPVAGLVRAAAAMYLAPAVAFLAGAVGAHLAWPGNDAAALAGAVLATAVVALAIRVSAPGFASGIENLVLLACPPDDAALESRSQRKHVIDQLRPPSNGAGRETDPD